MQSLPPPDLRTTLAAVLVGVVPVVEQDAEVAEVVDAVLACSQGEGVSALLAVRLQGWEGTAALSTRLQAYVRGLAEPLQEHVRGLAANELSQRSELRRVLQALAQSGIPVLVLKGHALAQWLYSAPYLRECSDIDLLFADREQAEAAGDALKALGYDMPYRPGRFAHELQCRRTDDQDGLDMHWALTAIPALDRLPGFSALQDAAIALPGLGGGVRGLGPVHALLHACVHRASNIGAGLGDRLKWLYDFHLLVEYLTQAQWEAFTNQCHQARISGIAASGLRASHGLLATALPAAVMERLDRDATGDALDATRLTDWRYMQRMNLAALDGLPAKAHWLWARAFPPVGYMRELYGRERGWVGLMGQRFWRLIARFTTRPDASDG